MRKFCLFLRSVWKNVVLKQKFKPFLLLFTDKSFRAEINEMYRLTKNCRTLTRTKVRFDSIIEGHRILYPEYVRELRYRILDGYVPDPIKVVAVEGGYQVIDGNHRHAALLWHKLPHELIEVDLLS